MVRIIAGLVLAVFCLAGPARACSTTASSTFCADGWISQPTDRRGPPDEQPGSGLQDGTDLGPGPDGLYVEGAVVVDDPASGNDGEL
jgi:hypothetical protein